MGCFSISDSRPVGWRKGFRSKMPIKLLDSTLVSLTLSVYNWAHYTAKKGAFKRHALLDYDSLLPEFVNITDGKVGDNKAAFDIEINPFNVVVADRGYCDNSAEPLGQQQCVLRGTPQGQYSLHVHRGATTARETRGECFSLTKL